MNTIDDPCGCIAKMDQKLRKKGLELRKHLTIQLDTGVTGLCIALEAIPTKRGVKGTKLSMPFCPFCGKKNP